MPGRPSGLSRLHGVLFRCYPPQFRVAFGDEAQRVFDARLASARQRSGLRAVGFALLALTDVIWSGLAERLQTLRGRRRGKRPLTMLHTLSDLLVGLRMLWRSRGVTALSIAALALGIGLPTAAFSVIDAVLLDPLPFDEPGRLVRVRGGQSYLDMADWTAGTTTFSGFGGFRAQPFDVVDTAGTARIPGAVVTGRFFDAVGVRPALGRLIGAADDRPGAERVAVLSDGMWRRQYAARPDVVGEMLSTADVRYRIVGVLPAEFLLPLTAADVIVAARPFSNEFDFRGVHSLTAVGRLAAGIELPAAQAAMDGVATQLAAQYPQSNQDQRFVLQPVEEWLLGDLRAPLLTLFAALAAFWLIACANVANLQVGRAVIRRDEIAVRRAIGASELRLTRLALIEQLCLIVPAGIAGAALASALLRVLLSFSLDGVPRLEGAAVDARALLFAATLTIATVIVFGAMPVVAALGRARRTATGHGERILGRARLIPALLTAEVAVTLVLTIGGGLLLRSYARLMRVDPGFETSSLLTFNLTLRPLPRIPPPPTPEAAAARTAEALAARNTFFNDVLSALTGIPGVEAVAATTDLPIAEGSSFHNLTIEGQHAPGEQTPEIYYRAVNAGFFAALGLPLRAGRDIAVSDHGGAPLVVVVNETFVRSHLSGQDPVGRRVRWSSGMAPWMTIIGVAADVRGMGLDAAEVPAVYGPFAQDHAVWRRSMDFALRTSVAPATIAPQVRQAVAAIDRSIPVMRLQSMDDLIARSTADRRFLLTFLSLVSAAALVVVIAGLYGAVAYAVRMRRSEFGVRLALGAQPHQVVRLALRQAWWSMAAGTVLGLAGAVLAVRAIAAFLFEVSDRDVMVYVTAAAAVALTATIAALVPAVRAGRIDPLIVLRRD